MADHVSFEQSAIARVAAAAKAAGWGFVSATRGVPFDGYVDAGAGVQVPVEFKLIRGEHQMRRFRDLVRYVRELSVSDLVMVLGGVTIDRQTLEDRLNSADGPHVHVLYLEDPEFDRNLSAAVERVSSKNVR